MRQKDVHGFLYLEHLVHIIPPHMVHAPFVVVVVGCYFKVSSFVVCGLVDARHASNPQPSHIDHAAESKEVDSGTDPASMIPTKREIKIAGR